MIKPATFYEAGQAYRFIR